MGVKKQYAKGRLDKYYHMAKEQGYRARSAFKLIQLNKKYNILEHAKVCVDLCAAPGGWLQVASKYMPKPSLIIGLDLVPIKPIPGVITHVEDITTGKCRATLKSELKTWKADVFLHDGAPNVGISWIQDAFTQSELTLSALKLATEFLVPNGTFVTKVFRSKDYNKLMWVFNQLFKSVEATKPSSSRNVSAEIFVVCREYLAPKKIDPRLLDPKWAFKEMDDDDVIEEMDPKKVKERQGAILNDLFHPDKRTRQRDGYESNIISLHKSNTVSEFIRSSEFIDIMARSHQLAFEKDDISLKIRNHPLTTEEIIEFLNDLKVLGKKEFKQLIKWREHMRLALEIEEKRTEKHDPKIEMCEKEETLDDIIEREQNHTEALAKRLKKKQRERKAKQLYRLRLGMETPADIGIDAAADMGALPDIDEGDQPSDGTDLSSHESSDEDEVIYSSDEEQLQKIASLEDRVDGMYQLYQRQKLERNPSAKAKKSKEGAAAQFEEWYGVAYDTEGIPKSEKPDVIYNSESTDSEEETYNSIKRAATPDEATLSKRAKLFYENPVFKLINSNKEDQGTINYESENENQDEIGSDDTENQDFTVVPVKKDDDDGPIIDTATSYTIAQQMVTKVGKRNLIDDAFNRYAFNDDDCLPQWFKEDEGRHNKPSMPVTKEAVMIMKQRMRALNARPIKKVAEVKFRKQMRAERRLERMAKKAEGMNNEEDISEKSKLEAISKLVSKTKAKKERQKTKVVVARGSNRGTQGRPKGVKGRYKMVDARMRKDTAAQKRKSQKK